jgi:divalent metal cation (Fe/Co/Zn/Cd) transporter
MQEQRRMRSERAVVIGLLVNIALAGTKLLAGLVGHSYWRTPSSR